MGLLDDLKMGLGLKERDDDYYERTARTLGRTQGADREATYRQSRAFKGKPKRAGLLSFMGGGSGGGSSSRSDREPSRGFLPTLFGYRDTEDMFDRGGPYASGGMYQGAGGYSLLANLAHAASGKEFGERTPYEKIEAQAVIKSTNGAVPEATRNAISSLRPMLRPDDLNVPGSVSSPSNLTGTADMPPGLLPMTPMTPTPELSVPSVTPPPAIPAPPVQSIQTTSGAPSMGMTLDEYIMSQGAPVNDMTKEQYLPSYMQGYGISY